MSDHKELLAIIESLGLAYSARFVPFSQSRHKDEKQLSLNWIITISKGQSFELQTDYMQGIGHLQGYDHSKSKLVWYVDCLRYACESGKWNPKLTYETRIGAYWKPIPEPILIDVLYSLVTVLNYPTFEGWASNYGFGTDSRKGEKTYKACLEIALKLRALLGEENLMKLRKAYQDY